MTSALFIEGDLLIKGFIENVEMFLTIFLFYVFVT